MTTFAELKERYMLTGSAPVGGSLTVPGGGSFTVSGSRAASSLPVYTGCDVEALIEGPAYFQRIKSEIDALTGRQGDFIYLAGWLFGDDFSLDGPSGGTPFADLLKAKAAAGVDVRVLGWVMAPEVLQNSLVQTRPEAASTLLVNANTMLFVEALRAEPALADKAVLNILSHPAGAVHCKMAIVGSADRATAFTGGIDFDNLRSAQLWHDVQAAVGGPAVQAILEAFRTMWNEIQGRAPVPSLAVGPFSYTLADGRTVTVPRISVHSHTSSMPRLPSRAITSPSTGRMHVQSLRTLPRFNFTGLGSVASLAGVGLPTNAPLSYAPSGLFEIRDAWEKAIRAARHYIYVEDQAFWAREIFDWIREAVAANDDLRVVLLIGQWDPTDQPNATTDKLFRIAVNEHLTKNLNQSQLDRIGFFTHSRRTVHTKTTIVDDHWALIGSANSMQRSLYTDFEHAVAFMDEDGTGVPRYRHALWGEHLPRSEPDPQDALDVWFSLPYQGSGALPSTEVQRIRLPLASAHLTEQEEVLYQEVFDADSRQAWGGRLARHFISNFGAQLLSR